MHTKKHKCKPDNLCICGALAEEPNEDCPVHGNSFPPRCSCGRFVNYKENWEKSSLAAEIKEVEKIEKYDIITVF